MMLGVAEALAHIKLVDLEDKPVDLIRKALTLLRLLLYEIPDI